VLIERPVTWRKVFDIPLWFTMRPENVDVVETCKSYDVAPAEAFQPSMGFVATPEAPLEGVESVGGKRAPEAVVKLQTVDQSLIPAAFVALTRQ
jgi:hypothetical protein